MPSIVLEHAGQPRRPDIHWINTSLTGRRSTEIAQNATIITINAVLLSHPRSHVTARADIKPDNQYPGKKGNDTVFFNNGR